MAKWQRFNYQPGTPLGRDGRRVTGCQEHIDLSRRAAGEGMVLMRNEGHVLPFPKGQRIVLLGKASIDYVKGGGGSGDVTVAYSRNIYEG
ncbi:MAG: beta-glucosidase, partial [Lachnospiraceae bacterium]|nr:beta-glucosidase [Lachnospiraceae bacterium]